MTNVGPESSGLTEASGTEAKTAAATEDVRRVARPTEHTSAYGGEGEYSSLRAGDHIGDPRHRGYELRPGPIFPGPIPREQASAFDDERGLRYAGDRRSHSLGIGRVEENDLDDGPQRSSWRVDEGRLSDMNVGGVAGKVIKRRVEGKQKIDDPSVQAIRFRCSFSLWEVYALSLNVTDWPIPDIQGANFSSNHAAIGNISSSQDRAHSSHIVQPLNPMQNNSDRGLFYRKQHNSRRTILTSRPEIPVRLLEKDANVGSEDNTRRTALSWAAQNGHEAVIASLLDGGPDAEAKDNSGRTALSWAAQNGHAAAVNLLQYKDADIESKDGYGRTALSWAAEKHFHLVPADTDSDYSLMMLSSIIENQHEVVIMRLLDKDADVGSKDNNGRTALLWAPRNGHKIVVKLLLEKDADLEVKDREFGRTALSWAAENIHQAVVKLVLQKDANVESKDNNGRTALSWAAEKYINLGLRGSTIMWTTENRHEVVIMQLLDKNSDIESKDTNGRTALSWAAQNGQEAVITLPLDEGADVESKDDNGRTALSLASRNGRQIVVNLLMSSQKTRMAGSMST